MATFEVQFQQFQQGACSETLQQWLIGSWQGDALQARSSFHIHAAEEQSVSLSRSGFTVSECAAACLEL